MSLTLIHSPLFGMQHAGEQSHRQLHRHSSFITLLLCVFSWSFVYLLGCLRLIAVFQSLRCCLFLFLDEQPVCWDGKAFRLAGMCQSSLTKWSLFYLILCFSAVVKYFPVHFPLSFSCPCIFFPSFSFRWMHLPLTLHIHTHIYGLQWQVWCLSHAGHCNTSIPFDTLSLSWAKSHIWQSPGEC